MDLNKKFNDLFDKLLLSEKHRKKLFKLIGKLNKLNILNDNLTLLLLKSLILILSVYPNKIKICIKILKIFNDCNKNTKNDILNFFNKLSIEQVYLINDEYIEKIIFKTLDLFEKIYYNDKKKIFIIWNQILITINKLKRVNKYFKICIYLKILKESTIILNNYNSQSFIKILDFCINVNKIINEYTK